jgi:hypothetical protein
MDSFSVGPFLFILRAFFQAVNFENSGAVNLSPETPPPAGQGNI